MRSIAAASSIFVALWPLFVTPELIRHDASWSPDTALLATAANVTIDCESRFSILLNGTTPGPLLYLEEGKTTWVRVYNQIPDHNLTVVCGPMILG